MTHSTQLFLWERACAYCGTSIEHRHWRSKRCQTCQFERERRAMNTKRPTLYERVCQHCGTIYQTPTRNGRYCGNGCSGLASHPGNVELACPVCGAGFTISAQYADSATCSRACGRWQRLYPGRKRKRTCGRCRTPIDRPNINAEYCSHLCAAVAGQARRAGRIPEPRFAFCLSCGARLEPGRPAGTRYCRRACQAVAGKERRAAKIAGARVERVYPIDIYERDGWTCHLCLSPIDPLVTVRYDPARVSLDHIIAVAAPDFPGHVWENLAAAHLGCNVAKGDRVTAHDRALYARLAARAVTATS